MNYTDSAKTMNYTDSAKIISPSAPKEEPHIVFFLNRLKLLNSQANDLKKSFVGALERYNGGEPRESCTRDLSSNESYSCTKYSLDNQLDLLEETLDEMKRGLNELDNIM